jgi:hypothetical protein
MFTEPEVLVQRVSIISGTGFYIVVKVLLSTASRPVLAVGHPFEAHGEILNFLLPDNYSDLGVGHPI